MAISGTLPDDAVDDDGAQRGRDPARRRATGPADLPPPEAIPPPGAFPFTRGNFPDGYRGRLWTIRQYSGFGTAEESNERYRYLLAQGGTGLSVALDLPTQCGYDSDHPDVEEEVGRVGVALDTLADAEILFDEIPLDAHQHELHDQRHRRDPPRLLRRGRARSRASTGRSCAARSRTTSSRST